VRKNLYKKILENDLAVILLFFSLFVLGIFSLLHMSITSLPRKSRPALTIVTDYYGMEPETIEKVITRPLERLLKEVHGVKDIDSFSVRGRSRIVVSLDPAVDVDIEAVLIMDSVYHVSRNFPREVRDPALYRYNTDDRPAIVVSLSGRGQSDMALHRLAEARIKEELMSVDGVANVEITGPGKQDYFIVQDYENMSRLAGNYDAVFNSIVAGNLSIPLGSMKNPKGLLSLDFPNTYKNLFNLSVYPGAFHVNSVSSFDIFSVQKIRREDAPLAFVNNSPELILYIFKKNHSRILRVDRDVRRVLQRWNHTLSFTYLYNQTEGFRDLLMQLLIASVITVGCILLLLIFFYRQILFVWLVMITILLCLSGTLAFLALFDAELNILTLSALIIGIGMCAVNTIIVIEPLQRALKLEMGSLRRKEGLSDSPISFHKSRYQNTRTNSRVENIITGTMVRSYRPLLSSTVTTIVVFLSLFYMNGDTVSLYVDFALAISLLLVLSCLVLIFFVPCVVHRFFITLRPNNISYTHKHLFLRKNQKRKTAWEKTGSTADFPLAVMKRILKRPLFNFVLLFFPGVIFAVLFITLDFHDVSPTKEGGLVVIYEFDPKFTASYKTRAVKELGNELLYLGIPLTLVTKLENERATFLINFPAHYRRYEKAVERIKTHIDELKRDDGFFYFDGMEESEVQSVRLFFFGDNLERLNSFVDKAAGDIFVWNGVGQILKGYKTGKPEIVLRLDTKKLYFYDLNAERVISFLRYVFYYPVIMKHYEDDMMIDVRAKIDVEGLNREALRFLRVPGNNSNQVSLTDFSSLKYQKSPGVITRKNGKRYISLDIRYAGMTEKEFTEKLRSYLDGVGLYDDYYWEFDRGIMDRHRSRRYFVFTLIIAVFSVYVALGIILKSFGLPIIIMSSVFSLFIGVYVFLIATGYARSVPAHVGFVFIIGLWANSTVLLLDEVLYLRKKDICGKRIERIILLALRRKMRTVALMLLTTVASAITVFIFTSSACFLRVLSGVIFSGLLIGIPLSVLMFLLMYRIYYMHCSGQ